MAIKRIYQKCHFEPLQYCDFIACQEKEEVSCGVKWIYDGKKTLTNSFSRALLSDLRRSTTASNTHIFI